MTPGIEGLLHLIESDLNMAIRMASTTEDHARMVRLKAMIWQLRQELEEHSDLGLEEQRAVEQDAALGVEE